jgi:lysophospholipase L1-like esterase
MNLFKNIKKEEVFIGVSAFALTYFLFSNFFSKSSLKKITSKKPENILIIGDSISAIFFANLKDLVKTQWSYLIKEDLKNKDINVDILALGGMTSKWMIGSLKDYLEGKDTNSSQPSSQTFNFKNDFKMSGNKKYDIVIIYTGVNDSFNGANEKGYQYVQEMVDIGNSMGAKVYLVLGYEKDSKFMNYQLMQPNRYIKTQNDYIPLVENYQRWQRELPTKIKGAEFIPKFNLNAQTGDGTHPNGASHKIIKEAVLNKIDV